MKARLLYLVAPIFQLALIALCWSLVPWVKVAICAALNFAMVNLILVVKTALYLKVV